MSDLPKPATSADRHFGILITIVVAAYGLLPMFHGHPIRIWPVVASALPLLAALLFPALLAGPRRLWLAFGAILHRITSPLVLGVVFFLVLTPVGVVMRVFGRDALRLKREPNAPSYWVKREPAGPLPESMTNQF